VTPADRRRFPDPTPEPAVHAELPDDTLLVFLSDVHIGGAAGVEIFDSAAELVALLEDLGRHQGPVELVLVGDFVDLLRMGDAGDGEDLVAATLARPEYRELFAALRAFAGSSTASTATSSTRPTPSPTTPTRSTPRWGPMS
jgi:hypothetical protein